MTSMELHTDPSEPVELHEPRWVKLVEIEGEWTWQSASRGAAGFKTADGFQLLQHILDEVFVQHHKKIGKMSQEIIRRKGPRKANS